MKNRSIGMVEYQTVSAGMTAADLMVKTAGVEILQSSVVCPGKYITLIGGELSAVRASIDAAKAQFGDKLSDSFVLGNPHEDIFPAIYGGASVENARSLGVLETFSAPARITRSMSASVLTPPPTANGMRIAFATAATMPMSIGRRSAEAVMS